MGHRKRLLAHIRMLKHGLESAFTLSDDASSDDSGSVSSFRSNSTILL